MNHWLLERDKRFERYLECRESWPQVLDTFEAAGETVQDGLQAAFTPLDVVISMAAALIRCKASPEAVSEALSYMRDNRLVPKELENDVIVVEQWNAGRNG